MAHGVVPTHEIFQKPLKVDLKLEEISTPSNYRQWPGGDELGPRMKAWKVQNAKHPEIDPGLVSDPYGFTDSPDAEVVSSGINSKGPEAVALGRHGNFFLWGFSAKPSDMTPSAQGCFVNSICYIKKFDGKKPLVRKVSSGRRWALVYAGYLKYITDDNFLQRLFPEELRKRFGKDAEKYTEYYESNLEYLRLEGDHFVVDEDVKELGISNRKIELLDHCTDLLERGEHTDVALRVLRRYTTESFGTAKEWRSWFKQNRGRLFFTDTGGYKFLVNPHKELAKP
jgi:hypothetical protein